MNNQTETSEQLKTLIKEKYSQIAEQGGGTNASSCCGVCGCGDVPMADDYTKLDGYVSEADLGLGCGLPTEFAKISEGDIVVDLGSGAGNDCFVARSLTGPKGKVIGIDLTEKMIEKARLNASKLGYQNIEFRQGDIENLPVASESANVIISNCVLNLVPDKKKAFEEIYRVLKKGGHFCISDIVLEGELPGEIREAVEMYVGCVAGAVQKQEYLEIVKGAGFVNVTIQKEKQIIFPDEILSAYLSREEVAAFKSRSRILSITLWGEKSTEKNACCSPACCH